MNVSPVRSVQLGPEPIGQLDAGDPGNLLLENPDGTRAWTHHRAGAPAGRQRGRLARLAAVMTLSAVVLAACGGGGSKKSTTATSSPSAGGNSQAFLDCLRQHGVSVPAGAPGGTFPGGSIPSGSVPPGGPPGGSVPGGAANSSAFQACQALNPGGSAPPGQQALVAFTSCMAQHGVTLTTAAGGGSTDLNSVDRTTPAYKTCSPLLPSGPANSSTSTTRK